MANKTAKKSNKKTDFSKSFKSLKTSAKTVNKEIKDTAEDVIEDIKATTGLVSDAAAKTFKETFEKVNDSLSADNVKKAAKNANKISLKAAEDIIDGFITGSEKWQGVAVKAIKGGVKLSTKQQDITFTALEAVKDQVVDGASRFKSLFKAN